MSPEPLRILVADDSADFRAGLAALVASVDHMSVVGDAIDGEATIAAALDLQPDVVLMDLNMPGRNGIEATRAIVSAAPHIAVLVLTMHEEDESVFSAVQAGARGYLADCSRTSPAGPAQRRAPSRCRSRCSARANASSRRARRSDGGYAATCTTGSARRSPARSSRSTPRGACSDATRRPPTCSWIARRPASRAP